MRKPLAGLSLLLRQLGAVGARWALGTCRTIWPVGSSDLDNRAVGTHGTLGCKRAKRRNGQSNREHR